MPLVSVIIPTKNRVALVRQAIESVLASGTEKLQTQIIVVDNSSTDQTASLVQAYPITYLHTKVKGVSNVRNVGLKAANGDYITFLDDDDIWPANNLVNQIALLEANPQFGAVCSQVALTDCEGANCSPPYPSPPFQSGWMFEDFLSYIPQVGSLLVRQDVMKAIGGFKTDLQGGEDWDWALRLAHYCQIGFLPEVALLWRMHNTARVDGVGNSRPEDIAWRRYTDVMRVARQYIKGDSLMSWIKAQRTILKHKGHYIPIFIDDAIHYAQNRDLRRSLRCSWLALRVSPPHVATHLFRLLTRRGQPSAADYKGKRQPFIK